LIGFEPTPRGSVAHHAKGRDPKVLQIVEGTSEIQRQIVSTYLKNHTGGLQGHG